MKNIVSLKKILGVSSLFASVLLCGTSGYAAEEKNDAAQGSLWIDMSHIPQFHRDVDNRQWTDNPLPANSVRRLRVNSEETTERLLKDNPIVRPGWTVRPFPDEL